MSERDAFLDSTMPRQIEAETAMHNGQVEPRISMWSSNDPVTLFGAWFSATGWDDVSGIFKRLVDAMEKCESYDVELVAADASGDLAYTVAYEHTTATVNGEPSTYTLRVTHIYRRENGEWKIVHRHGDRMPDKPSGV
jgi:ketosteroid isomerase-like protein